MLAVASRLVGACMLACLSTTLDPLGEGVSQ